MTPDFQLREFESPDGAPMPATVEHVIRTRLAPALQVIRDHVGGPLRLTSGWRSHEHNVAVGGARLSRHLSGEAADIVPPRGTSVASLHSLILGLIERGLIPQGGVGVYDRWVHYDVRGFRARWDRR